MHLGFRIACTLRNALAAGVAASAEFQTDPNPGRALSNDEALQRSLLVGLVLCMCRSFGLSGEFADMFGYRSTH